ncbi:MAG TPA: glycosyltransferase [Bryobacteraceae bacterium]|nr:glycosyltransferase [Bryobacteraceae bacterium]
MKVLYVVPTYYPAHFYGGPIQSVYHLCRNISRLGGQVRVLTTNANGPRSDLKVAANVEQELDDGVRVTYCRRVLPQTIAPTLLAKLPAMVRWADVVHLTAVYSFPIIPTLLDCRLARKPVVWSPRGALQRWQGSTRVLMKDAWDGVSRLVKPRRLVLHVTSEEEAVESVRRYPGVATAIIPNGVEIPETVLHPESAGRLRMVFLGRIHQKKGIENLLDACEALGGVIDWSLTIAGTGDPAYVQSIAARIDRLGLAHKVRMIGAAVGEAKRRLFENADLMVTPSFTENFAIVVAEALAHGVPVLASRGTPWHELPDRGCGDWIENDPASLRAGILRMSRMDLRRMGERGREWMLRDFSWHERAEETWRLYEGLISAPAGAGAPGNLIQAS